MEAAAFVPAHAPICNDIAPLVQRNVKKVREIADRILALCTEPAPFEAILRGLFDAYGLSMNEQQYVLVGSTLRSYLAWLRNENRLTFHFAANQMLWQRFS